MALDRIFWGEFSGIKKPAGAGFLFGAPGEIIRPIHGPHPTDSLCSCKIAPGNFVGNGMGINVAY